VHLLSVLPVLAVLVSGAATSADLDRQTQGETSRRDDDSRERDRITVTQAHEAEFREDEEPAAIRRVASELHLAREQTEQLLAWEASFRLSARVIWTRPPDDNADEKRRGRRVAALRRDLARREKKLLADKYYEFTKMLAREMNRRRWLKDGQTLPRSDNVIHSD
jgi:hypothetical protein